MGIEESVNFFGSGNKLCKALGLARQNLTDWRRKGYIPMIQQMRLERVTEGKLRADREATND
jgi:predicted site-specific integrase-resolvase